MLSAVTTSLLVCVVKLFIWYVAVCCTSGTHTHRQHYSHIPNKQPDDANKQSCSNSTKHERRPPEDGQTIVTETCRVLIDVFYKHF